MQSYNRYAYVINNPLKYVDPTGNEHRCSFAGRDDCEQEPSVVIIIGPGGGIQDPPFHEAPSDSVQPVDDIGGRCNVQGPPCGGSVPSPADDLDETSDEDQVDDDPSTEPMESDQEERDRRMNRQNPKEPITREPIPQTKEDRQLLEQVLAGLKSVFTGSAGDVGETLLDPELANNTLIRSINKSAERCSSRGACSVVDRLNIDQMVRRRPPNRREGIEEAKKLIRDRMDAFDKKRELE